MKIKAHCNSDALATLFCEKHQWDKFCMPCSSGAMLGCDPVNSLGLHCYRKYSLTLAWLSECSPFSSFFFFFLFFFFLFSFFLFLFPFSFLPLPLPLLLSFFLFSFSLSYYYSSLPQVKLTLKSEWEKGAQEPQIPNRTCHNTRISEWWKEIPGISSIDGFQQR